VVGHTCIKFLNFRISFIYLEFMIEQLFQLPKYLLHMITIYTLWYFRLAYKLKYLNGSYLFIAIIKSIFSIFDIDVD